MDWLHWLLVAVVGALLAYLYGESRARATESRLRQEMKLKKSKSGTPPFPPVVPSSASAAVEETEDGSLFSSSSSPVLRQRQNKAVAFSAALPPRSKSSLAAIIDPPSSSSASSRPLHPSSLIDLIATADNNNNERSLASEKKRPHSTSSLLKAHSSDASTAALAKREREQKQKNNKKKESQRMSAETQTQTVRRQSQRSFTEKEVAHNLEELRQRFLDANLGVPLKLRKYSKMQCYCRSFLGREAVDWLLDNVELEPAHSSPTLASSSNSSDSGSSNYDRKTDPLARQKAVDLGVRLWASGLFRHATHGSRRPFTDGDVLFQFTKEGKKKMKKLTKLENNYIENFNNANKQQSKSNKQKSSMKLTKKSSIGKKSSRFLLRSGSKNSSLSSSGEFSTMRESKKDGEEEEEIVTTEAVETEESSNLEQHLKRREGWVDVQLKEERWVKHWCVLREIDPVQQQQQQQDHFAEQQKSGDDDVNNDGGDQRGGEGVGGDLSQAQKKPGWELAVFVEPHDNHLKKLLLTMLDPVIGVSIKTRHYHLKAYESCFVGKEAVDWYMANHRINSRSEAVTILDELREKGLIQHVVGDHCFKDEKLFYRFHINRAQIAAFGEAPPLVAIPLKDCLLKLERSGKCYEVIVYRPDFSPLIHDQQQTRQLDLPIEHEFHFRLPKKEYPAVQRWIFALEAAIVLGDAPESCATPHDLLDSEEEDDDLVEEQEENTEEMEEEEEKEIIEEEEEEEKVIVEELSNAEKVVLQEMKAKLMKMQEQAEKVKEEDGNSSSMMDSDINYDELSDKQLLQYLRVKKLNVEEAITLLHRSIPYRKQHNLYNIQLPDVINEVGGKDGESGMLRLLEQARDKEGRRILLGFPKFYAPSRSPPLQVVRAIMYLLDIAMKDDELTQQEGFSVIVDGKGSKYSNFDPKMPRVMIEGIVSKYPARIGHVMLLHCPWFFKFIWAVVRPLLSQKLASKVHIMSSEKELLEYVEPCNLLPMHGGTFHHDQRAWIEARCTEENLPSPFSS